MNKLMKKIICNMGIVGIVPLMSTSSYAWPPSFLSRMTTDNMGQLMLLLHPGMADALNGVFSSCEKRDAQVDKNLAYSANVGNAVKAWFEDRMGKFVVHPQNQLRYDNGNEIGVKEFEVAETMITQEMVVEFLHKNPTLVWNGVGNVWNFPNGNNLGSYRPITREDCPKDYEEIDVGEKEVEREENGRKVKIKERNLVPICRGHGANYLSKEDLDELAGKVNEVAKHIVYREKEVKPGNTEGQEYTYQYSLSTRPQEVYYISSMDPETKEVTTTEYSFGNDAGKLKEHAVYWDEATHPNQPERSVYKLKTRKPNSMGLYDTHGTLWEVTQTKTQDGSYFLVGGGSWNGSAELAGSRYVSDVRPGLRYVNVGGRFVRTKVLKK